VDGHTIFYDRPDFDINSEFFKKTRAAMLSGESVLGCEECYEEEAATGESLRLSSNKKLGTTVPRVENVSSPEIESLEIFLGSKCNLMCIGCSPILSSSLREEYIANNWPIPEIREDASEESAALVERLVNLKHIKFMGGEPLLNKLHDKIINTLGSRRLDEMELIYFTNCTIWPTPETLETWSRSKRVELNMSIDAFGAKNEYMRFNSRWEKVEKIVRQYFAFAAKNPHVVLQMSVTVSTLNMLYLKELEAWYEKIRCEFRTAKSEPAYMTYLIDPEPLALHNAPPALIDKMLTEYEWPTSYQQKKIADLLRTSRNQEPRNLDRSFVQFITMMDGVRKTSVRDTFPALGEFFPQKNLDIPIG